MKNLKTFQKYVTTSTDFDFDINYNPQQSGDKDINKNGYKDKDPQKVIKYIKKIGVLPESVRIKTDSGGGVERIRFILKNGYKAEIVVIEEDDTAYYVEIKGESRYINREQYQKIKDILWV